MRLADLKGTKNFYTEKLSDVNRNLSFAGIAVIWIFKYGESGAFKIPEGLVIPSVLLILSLFFDLLQFVYGSITWTIVFRKKEKTVEKDQDFKVSKKLSNPMYYFFFFPKVIFNIAGYIFIFVYLIPLIFS